MTLPHNHVAYKRTKGTFGVIPNPSSSILGQKFNMLVVQSIPEGSMNSDLHISSPLDGTVPSHNSKHAEMEHKEVKAIFKNSMNLAVNQKDAHVGLLIRGIDFSKGRLFGHVGRHILFFSMASDGVVASPNKQC